MKVAICVITFRRPAGIQRLLESLARLDVGDALDEAPVVVVVDNDPAGSARLTCEQTAQRCGVPLRYVIESERGIPAARNAALDAAGTDVDAIAFVDDDEEVPEGWLLALLRCYHDSGADIVTGPMAAHFVVDPPDWVRGGRYFESPTRYATGTRRPVAASGNVLISTRALVESGVRFDTRFALSGGSDTHFFLRIARLGFSIIWCDEAVATEWIPASRVNRRWLLRRAFRLGTTSGLCAREIGRPRAVMMLVRAAKGAGRMLQGAALLLPYLVMPRRRALDALRMIWFGSGVFVGLAGRHFHEYEQIHAV